MTEINATSARQQPSQQGQQGDLTRRLQELQQQREEIRQAQAEERKASRDTRQSANRLSGMASGLNTQQTIETIINVERRRLRPVRNEKLEVLQELESFRIINDGLENLQGTVQRLAGSAVWEGKIVESSNEDVVTATATAGAKPGKHTLIVEKLALNHQLASQGYESTSDPVGQGKFNITVGEGNPISVVVDESNNSLQGLKDAINFATDEVSASIIRTGNPERPHQLVVSSQTTGSEGRLTLDVQLEGGETPDFSSRVGRPSPWKGVGEAAGARATTEAAGTGASTSIVEVVGDYGGEEDNRFTFTAVQTGQVGEAGQLQVRWQDQRGRSGVLDLGKFNYSAGEPVEFVDGLALVFSPGEIVVGDSFSFEARPQRSERFWWLSDDERAARVTQPTAWSRQATVGGPIVEGEYTGDEEQTYTLRVLDSGQVGATPELRIRWENEQGDSGVLRVGEGYEPGTKLAIEEGLTLALKPGVLSEDQRATFEVEPRELSGKWWLSEDEREIPAEIRDVTNWRLPEELEEEGEVARMPGLPAAATGARVSSTRVAVEGDYEGDESKVYTFTAQRDGAVGTTRDLTLRWEDDQGNTGTLAIGDDYEPGTPLAFDAGLALRFSPGRVFAEDEFTLRVETATVQPPQDAQIRFGATELGGGLKITSPTNEMDDVIDGVRLNLVSTSDKPVTITIRGDTEQAIELVRTFVDQFNELSTVISELTKYEPDSDESGPLLGDRNVIDIRNRIADRLMDPVAGLPREMNMLFAVGISFNDQGLLELDQTKLQKRVEEDFGLLADLFRNKGESDNSQVAFAGMTPQTNVKTDGYPVDVERPANQGRYVSPPLARPIVIDETNDQFTVTVNSRQSDTLELPRRTYTVAEYARALQDAITNDERVGDLGVRVLAEGDRIKVLSGRFGSRSSVSFSPIAGQAGAGVGLLRGESTDGRDVEGTINGVVAEGTGQLLSLPDEDAGPASGLRTFVKLNEEQLDPNGPEARIVVTKGVASRVAAFVDSLVNPITGRMRSIQQNLGRRVDNLDDQLERLEGRIDRKRQSLQEKFSRLESRMSRLRSQQQFMSAQLSSLPGPAGGGGGGAGGIPGLPGMPTP